MKKKKQRVIRTAKQQSAKETAVIVNLMIKKGYSTEEIISVVSGYSQYDVKTLRKALEKEILQTV